MLAQLFAKFYNFKIVFDQSKINKYFSYCLYNYKIEFENKNNQLSKSCIYQIFIYKLLKIKKYLKKNLKKRFINSSNALFVLLILFAIKLNKELYFCVNYWKLNILTKRNRYSILLIEKTLIRIINCKYLTKLDIIVVFNKLRIYSKNEDFTIFVIFIKVYKYYMLLFELTNDFASYQYYINNVLFECLYNFYQVYFDNVLVYNKTRKKHTQHVHLVLQKLINARLQVNIRINSLKIQIIIA